MRQMKISFIAILFAIIYLSAFVESAVTNTLTSPTATEQTTPTATTPTATQHTSPTGTTPSATEHTGQSTSSGATVGTTPIPFSDGYLSAVIVCVVGGALFVSVITWASVTYLCPG